MGANGPQEDAQPAEGVPQKKKPNCLNNWSLALVVILIASLISCSGDGTEPITEQELVGQWAATEIEGAIDANGNPLAINGSVSTWTFNADGTYQWFLHAQPFFNLDGTGTYSLSGNILTVTGIIASTLFSATTGNEDTISITFGSSTFSFRDEDGSLWRYAKVQ